MNTYDVINLFSSQLERRIALGDNLTKVVLTPSSVEEKGMVIKVSLKKTYLSSLTKGIRSTRVIKLRLAVEGTAESMTGLSQALSAIEALDVYLGSPVNLEDETGKAIPDTRILQNVSEEDSFLPSPDVTNVQDVLDERTITITVPS